MEERIELARRGRELWLSLVEEFHIDNSMQVILLPDTKREHNVPAVKYLNKFLEKKYAKKAIVLTHDEWVLGCSDDVEDNIDIIYFSREDAQALIQFYCLYEFATNFVIASLVEPCGRLGNGLLNKGDITPEEIFLATVYGLFVA